MVGVSLSRGWILAAAALLASCGGGGGSGTGPVADSAAGANVSGTATAETVLLRGTVTFDSVPNVHGALDYASTTAKPVRGAAVELIGSTGTVLASTTTDDAGRYAAPVASNTALSVRVKALLLRAGEGPSWDVTVRDNTAEDAVYALDSPAFSSGSATSLVRDIHAPSGWGGAGYTLPRAAAPFALLDTVYTNMRKVLSVETAANFPALRLYWSPLNAPASGDVALGQIGTTSFEDSATHGRAIYVLGRENVDTDEYDSSVISHEWGHYYQSVFSRDDSPGGSHGSNDLLDRRLAFSEGWGNAWSGIAQDLGSYTDSGFEMQSQGLEIDLSTGPTLGAGWFREDSIQAILWNLNRQVGFQPIHRTLSGPFKSTLAVTSIHPFAAAFATAAPADAGVLTGLLASQNIGVSLTDPFGALETNDGGVTTALPMYGVAGGQACVSSEAGTGNKLGRFAYVQFSFPTAGDRQIAVHGTGQGARPVVEVYNAGRVGLATGQGNAASLSVNLPAGTSVLAINDGDNDTRSRRCFSVSIH